MEKFVKNYVLWWFVFWFIVVWIFYWSSKVIWSYSAAVDDEELTHAEWKEWRMPQWAVMAFDLSTCPDGWSRYTKADDRFIMWSNSNFGSVWGNSSVSLEVKHIPNHSHYFRDTAFMESANADMSSNWNTLRVDWQETRMNWPGSNWWTDYDNTLLTVYRKTSWNILSSAGNSHTWVDPNWYNNDKRSVAKENLNIQNPYVKLLICKKG